MKGVHFSDIVNWLVICNYSGDDRHADYVAYYDGDHYDDTYAYKDISIEQFVIISLDLR
ncbi:hypothetical protein A2U01_0082656, partial [Trifolium medium]|nr:hypothetical protein [Trifolium medium]